MPYSIKFIYCFPHLSRHLALNLRCIGPTRTHGYRREACASAFMLKQSILLACALALTACNSEVNRQPQATVTTSLGASQQISAEPAPTELKPTEAPPTVAGSPRPKSAKSMIADWSDLNGRCRGGSGNDPRTMSACDDRDALSANLDATGWCHGKVGEWVGDAKWHRCTAQSCQRQPGGSC